MTAAAVWLTHVHPEMWLSQTATRTFNIDTAD